MANDSLDFVQRGKVSIVRRQYADAVKICRLGLLAHPTLIEGRLVLGMALTALQRWDEVLAEMRVALEVEPSNALAWLLKGEALVGKGDLQQAESSLVRAKELDPSNTKADQLLGEIQVALAAGFEGIPVEPTETKVYPAKASSADDKPKAFANGNSVADLPEATGEHRLPQYEEDATQVDPDPSNPQPIHAVEARVLAESSESTISRRRDDEPDGELKDEPKDDEEEDTSTSTYRRARGSVAPNLAPAAAVGFAVEPRSAAPSLGDEPSRPGHEAQTPLEMPRRGLGALAGLGRLRAPEPSEVTEPSIELSGSDLIPADSARFDFSDTNELDDEEERTRQRARRQSDDNASTSPERPSPPRMRSPRPFAPGPEVAAAAEARRVAADPWPAAEANGRAGGPGFAPMVQPLAPEADEGPTGTDGLSAGDHPAAPGVVRVPVRPPTQRVAPPPSRSWSGRLPSGGTIALLATALVAVIAVGVVTGLVVREWRLRARVAKRHALAAQKLLSGNYPGFQAAELLYRQILAERDDPLARALRARTLAEMSFEFGDAPEAAARAVTGLGQLDTPEAQQARIYLALARCELDRAATLATAFRRKYTDARASYLVGRAELLLERPESAVDALRAAAEKEPRDPMVLHGLGLAEAAAGRDAKAAAAYRQALEANANHIATLIDRAALQVRRGPAQDRDAARGALEGVVTKLVADASPGQLARAYLGLAELELARGDLEAARQKLAQAVGKRREGDAQLSEALAGAFARAYELDQAEKEARSAVAGFGVSARLGPQLILADVALRRGRPMQALQVLEDAATSRPEALILRAVANLQLGRKEAARSDVDAALRVQANSIPARVALAHIELADGHPERALRELDKIERSGVKSPEVAAALGAVHAARNPDRARWWLGEAIKRDVLVLEPRLQLARTLRDAGRLEEARAELLAALQINPSWVPARRDLAMLDLVRGDALAARAAFDALAEHAPDHETLLGAARARLQLGDAAGAEARVARALKLAPTGTAAEEATALLARTHLLLHQPEKAIELLRKVVVGAQRGETAGLLMAAYLDLDQQDKAASVRLVVSPKLRGAPELLVGRARLAVERGRDVSAEALATEALKRLSGPSAPSWVKSEALTILGRSRWEQGSFGLALKALKAATAADPANARAYYYLGMVYDDQRRPPDALAALETATRLDPKLAEAHYYLARARQQLKDPKAADAFRTYLEVAPKGIYADEARRALAGAPKTVRKKRRFGR